MNQFQQLSLSETRDVNGGMHFTILRMVASAFVEELRNTDPEVAASVIEDRSARLNEITTAMAAGS